MPLQKPSSAIIIMLLLLFKISSYAQSEQANTQLWLDYNPSFVINSKTSIYGDLSARTINSHDWYRYIGRVSIKYKPFYEDDKAEIIKMMQFHAGLGDFFTQSISDTNLNEFRLIQGVRVYWPMRKRIRLSHFVRLEERFEKFTYDDDVQITARMRYLIQGNFRFKAHIISSFYLPWSIEFFMPLSSGIYFNDAIRITPAIGYDISDSFRTEFHLSYHNSRNSPDDSYQNNDVVFRFRVFQIF